MVVVEGAAPSAGEGTGAGAAWLSIEPSPEVVVEVDVESGLSAARFFNRQ